MGVLLAACAAPAARPADSVATAPTPSGLCTPLGKAADLDLPALALRQPLPLLVAGGEAYACTCGAAHALAGDDERRTLAGDDERRTLAGDDERRTLAGDDERRTLAGDDERRALAGDDERRTLAGDDERRALAGDDAVVRCGLAPGCSGFVVFGAAGDLQSFDGAALRPAEGTCLP